MLMFERREGQGFVIGGVAKVIVSTVRGRGRVRLAVHAPDCVPVWREELEYSAESRPFHDVRVVVVEDDDAFFELLEASLELLGVASVSRFVRSADAVEFLEETAGTKDEASIVLVDYHLPESHGAEIVSRIRANADLRRIPTVMFSGDDSEECVDRSIDAGANAYMVKPNDFSGISSTLQQLLGFWASPSRVA